MDKYERPELRTKLELEKFMSEYYTHVNFKLFQEELLSGCIDCETKIVSNGLPSMVFLVTESDKGARAREVAYNSLSRVAHCMFEIRE